MLLREILSSFNPIIGINLSTPETGVGTIIWVSTKKDSGTNNVHGMRIKIKSNGNWIPVPITSKGIDTNFLDKYRIKGKLRKQILEFIDNNFQNIQDLWNDIIDYDQFRGRIVRLN